MGKLKQLEARVLVSIKEFGVEANHVLQGAEEHIARLVKAGFVDIEPDAVAYAKSIGSPIVALNDDGKVQGAKPADADVGAVVGARAAAMSEVATADAEVAAAEVQASAQGDAADAKAADVKA